MACLKEILEILGNDDFFALLASPYKEAYYDCALRIIDYSKRESIDVPFEEALFYAEKALSLYPESTGKRDALLSAMASHGWITQKTLSENNRCVISATSGCIRFLTLLDGLEDEEDLEIMNNLLSMAEVLEKIDEPDSIQMSDAYTHVYKRLLSCMKNFKSDITSLFTIMGKTLSLVLKTKSKAEFCKMFEEKGVVDSLFSSFTRFKNEGKCFVLSEIITNGIEKILNDEYLLNKIVDAGIRRIGGDCDESVLKSEIEYNLNEIYDFFYSDFKRTVSELDKKFKSSVNDVRSRLDYSYEVETNDRYYLGEYFNIVERYGLDAAPDLSEALNVNFFPR